MLPPRDTQHVEIPKRPPCIALPNYDSSARRTDAAWSGSDAGLYTAGGERKYLNRDELGRFVRSVRTFEKGRALFGLLLMVTGARVSEVLALTPASFQLHGGTVTFRTLKRRKASFRELPIPDALMQELDEHFGLAQAQHCGDACLPLWPFARVTAWRFIKQVMDRAEVYGRMACPRGLRHAFGVAQIQSKTELNIIQKWMGHARLSTTAIYTNVMGPEEVPHAQRYWDTTFPGVWSGASIPASSLPPPTAQLHALSYT